MPTKDGKIYSEVVNGVKYGITPEDVSSVIGENSLDLGTLCTSPKIKIWSKIKPQWLPDNYETPGEIPIELRNASPVAKWGLKYPELKTLDALEMRLGMINGGNWLYSKPNWYRLTDFDGYNHNAGCFMPVLPETQTVGLSPRGNSQFTIDTEIGRITQDSLQSSDFAFSDDTSFSDAYLGIAIRILGGNWYFATNSKKGLNVPLDVSGFRAADRSDLVPNQTLLGGVGSTSQDWDAFLFASNKNILQSIENLLLIPLNQGVAKTIKFTTYGNNTGENITLRARWDEANQQIIANILFHNYESGAVYFKGGGTNDSIAVQLNYTNSIVSGAFETRYLPVPTSDGIKVNGESTLWSDDIVLPFSGDTLPWVIVPSVITSSGHTLNASVRPLMEAPTEPPVFVDPSDEGSGWNDW